MNQRPRSPVFITSPLPWSCAAALAASLMAPAAVAQMQITSAGDGGAVPGKTTVELSGSPNAGYLLLFSETEQRHTPLPGLRLGIALNWLDLCISSPLFRGQLDGAGRARTTIPVPNLPTLYGTRFTLQSLQVAPRLGAPSNLLRVTLQRPGTFAPTLGRAVAPLVTGQGFVQPDGKVLFLGGSGPVVQEYDPALETFRLAGAVPAGNVLATQTALADGTILVCGGLGLNGQPVKRAFLYDPKTRRSTALPDLGTARAGHAAARLQDGRVLIVGGASSLDFTDLPTFLAGIRNTSEFFDPKTRTFRAGPALLEQKVFHSATTLGNGEVLVAGGLSVVPVLNVPIVSPTAQAYMPALNLFGFPRLMAKPRMLHGAVALGNGRALLAGGVTIDFAKFLQTRNPVDLAISSVDDAVTYSGGLFGGFSGSKSLSKGRMLPAVAPLGRDGALIAGGFDLKLSTGGIVFQPLAAADLFDGSNITATGAMAAARVGAVAVTLPDGTVLVTGGGDLAGEIYQPR